jgi:hypothetical protein
VTLAHNCVAIRLLFAGRFGLAAGVWALFYHQKTAWRESLAAQGLKAYH